MSQISPERTLLVTLAANLSVLAKIVQRSAASEEDKAAIDGILRQLQSAADPVTGGLLGITDD